MPAVEKLNVVVVDDMASSRAQVVEALATLGVRRIATAASGKEAMERIAVEGANLVLCDRVMPEMDGLDLLRRLRSGYATRGIGFILLSGLIDAETIERARDENLDAFLPKPFALPDLRRALEIVGGPL